MTTAWVEVREINILTTMGCRLFGNVGRLERRRHSPRESVGRQNLRVLTRKGIDVTLLPQSVNGRGAQDLWTNFQSRSLHDGGAWPRNDALLMELVEFAGDRDHARCSSIDLRTLYTNRPGTRAGLRCEPPQPTP